jgi:hypothetical protein
MPAETLILTRPVFQPPFVGLTLFKPDVESGRKWLRAGRNAGVTDATIQNDWNSGASFFGN